jgi:tetratricopeptide (TPR) repeat protein
VPKVLARLCLALVAGLAAAQTPQSGNEAVDARVCSACHAAIAAGYAHSGMGRSFYRPGARNEVENYASGLPFYHAATGAYYTMSRRGGQYFQSRWQKGPDGKPVNPEEWRVDYVMGSGNHVRTYLHGGANGTLTELPLAWYAEKGGYWAMNPGYDTDHFVAPRKIAYECMFCHNAYPRIPAGHERANSVPVYLDPLPEGIDCQRCHGPGGRHVRAAQAGAGAQEVRAGIVNPARLSGERQMEICMQCHLQTTSFRLPAAIRRFERGPFSYRAGEPLAAFALFFDRAPAAQQQPRFEIVSAVARLRESRCFRESKGALSCTTCHDPHREEGGRKLAPLAAHYNAACRQCHSATFDSLVAAGRHTRAADCVDCHMPKRRTDDVVHAVMTDHRIQRLKPPGDLLAAIPERHETEASAYHGAVVPYYPVSLSKTGEDALYLAVAQVEQQSNVAEGAVQLAAEIATQTPRRAEFYFEMGEAWRAQGETARAIAAYRQALERDPNAAWTLRRLAAALIAAGDRAGAAEMLARATKAAPEDARGWYALAELQAESGRPADAIAAFQTAVKADPDLSEAYNSLGGLLAGAGRMPEAESAFRAALRVQPDLAGAQANMALLLASKGDLAEAVPQFEAALRSQPGNAAVRCNYAIALAQLNRVEEAERQLQLVLDVDPGYAEAHLDLGILLAGSGDKLKALDHLNRATKADDPRIRGRAEEMLRRIRQ